MENINAQNFENNPPIHWGHFGVVLLAVGLLGGVTWMTKPSQLFGNQKFEAQQSNADIPKYYAYVPTEQPVPEVAGASTLGGVSVINEDGTVLPVDAGEVLAANTQDVQLSYEGIHLLRAIVRGGGNGLRAQKVFRVHAAKVSA